MAEDTVTLSFLFIPPILTPNSTGKLGFYKPHLVYILATDGCIMGADTWKAQTHKYGYFA